MIHQIKNILVLLFIVGVSTIGCTPKNANVEGIQRIDTNQFLDLLASQENVKLLDVRTDEEVSKGVIKHAFHVSIDNPAFKQVLDSLDKSTPVIVYCAGGSRSENATLILNEMGFTNVYDYIDGYNGWIAKE